MCFKSNPTLCNPLDSLQPARLLCPWALRQELWSGLPLPSPVDLPYPRNEEPVSLVSLALAGGFFITSPPGKCWEQGIKTYYHCLKS